MRGKILRGAAVIRPLAAGDGGAIADIVAACWAEYPGIVAEDIADERPLMLRFADEIAQGGGAAFVADRGDVAGVIGVRPERDAWEIVRLYVRADARGAGIADALLACAETHAMARGAKAFVLHSDTRFTRAHAFYERHGYLREGALRVLQDRSASLEFGYGKPVDGVRVLDAAAASSAVAPLAALLVACVDAGAAIGFLPPFSRERARDFWRARARDVAEGSRIMLVAWSGGRLVGTVTVTPSPHENEPDGAEIGKLLVHPHARRGGIGCRLMAEAERAAAGRGLLLLWLFAVAHGAVEPFYRAMDYAEVGRLPGTALLADGTRADGLMFWKRLG